MILISGVALQKLSGGEHDLTLFFLINACQSTTKAFVTTHSHFDKHQYAPVRCYQVDFTQALPVVPFDDAQTMSPDPCRGDQLGGSTFEIPREIHFCLQGVAGDSISRWLRIWLQSCVRRNWWEVFMVSKPVAPQMVLESGAFEEGRRLISRYASAPSA